MYVATLFVLFQITNYLIFRTLPTPPVLVGGALIVSGGMIIAFWR
jgi:small multidrug resistance family-3 protein